MTSRPDRRPGRHTVTARHAHLVLVTGSRRCVPGSKMLTCREQITPKACQDFGAELVEFNGHDNHGHLLVAYPPKVVVSVLLNSLNGVSARRLRPEFTSRVNTHPSHSHFWSPSYFAAS